MTLLSTLASTHQAHYKLKTEKYQFDTSLKQLEDDLWTSFTATTQFRGLIVDLETAFAAFAKKSIGSMPFPCQTNLNNNCISICMITFLSSSF